MAFNKRRKILGRTHVQNYVNRQIRFSVWNGRGGFKGANSKNAETNEYRSLGDVISENKAFYITGVIIILILIALIWIF